MFLEFSFSVSDFVRQEPSIMNDAGLVMTFNTGWSGSSAAGLTPPPGLERILISLCLHLKHQRNVRTSSLGQGLGIGELNSGQDFVTYGAAEGQYYSEAKSGTMC